MAQLVSLNEVSYVQDLLPEILWIGLINDYLGFRNGISLTNTIIEIAHAINNNSCKISFAICSSYNLLNEQQKNDIVAKLTDLNLIKDLSDSLEPISGLYKGFPLNFICPHPTSTPKETLLERIKKTVIDLFDKYTLPSVAAQSMLTYSRITTGCLKIPNTMKIPDFNAIFEDFNSEEAKWAAGFIRSSAITELSPELNEGIGEWSKTFWNQGLVVDSCSFMEDFIYD